MASSSTARQNQTKPENAFDEVAPYSVPKSTEPWDIFINHRGSDMKYTLATTIYDKLHSMGLHVFLDEAGDCIPAEIQHAITSATLQIAIFSVNYAQFPFCLAELSFMLKTGKRIIPIFYHVDPSDLRWIGQGKGKYAPAFSEYEKKGRYKSEKLDEWKGALHNSSFLSGYLVNNDEDEARVLKNIVNCAIKIMKKKGPLWVTDRPVGLDELVQGFESVAGEETVKITGIVGMGGSGKTTLAKELFNRNFSSFERCSFVFDVREAASRNALPDKQKKLLADLGVHHSPFDHVDEGKVILANRLSSHRALIVLDDVDHIDQLNALLPNKDILGFQSMVIVTTRELGVLISRGLSCIYKMPGLSMLHAEELFCWHAFLQTSPPAEFETLVDEFLKACNGLPLSLKVSGAQLYGRKSIDYWKSQLHKILRILPGEIKEKLQVSYDALDEEEREIFLDVACFLIEEEKSTGIAVWDGSGWSGLYELETLLNKCLVEVVEEEFADGFVINRIRMHDQLRDMGREIASGQSPYRLWCPQQIHDLKKHYTKLEPIRGIKPADAFVAFKEYTDQLAENSSRRSKCLGLKILFVKGNEFTEEFASEELVWLRWECFPLGKFPSWLALQNLSVLELHIAYDLEELWQDNEDLPLQLRELILLDCRKLQWLPSSINHLQDLKRLDVEFHGSTLSNEFCGLQSLENLRLDSQVLSSLPDGFGNLTRLRNISLINCEQLCILPDSFSQLIHLEVLLLVSCEILSSLPGGFGNLTSLKRISLTNNKQLRILPDSFSQLTNLEIIDLSYCTKLSSLPDGFGNLRSLRNINLEYCEQLSMLPDSFSELTHLEILDLSYCSKLSSLPYDFSNLISLRDINLKFCFKLSILPEFSNQMIQLEILDLSHCTMLFSLPSDFGNLTSLRNIKLTYCQGLSMLPDSFNQLIHLEILDLSYCKMLSSLPDGFGNLTSLRNINLEYCEKLSMLPDSFSQLIQLEVLVLKSCEMLSSMPIRFGNLTSLRSINLKYCDHLNMLPDSFSQLIHLEILDLSYCTMLSSLPDGFGNLTSLKNISLIYCEQLSILPDSFSQLIHPIDLDLSGCEMLSSLPETLPVSLNNLKIFSCNFLKNIRCISGLINLETLEICDFFELEELPSFADLASLRRFKMSNCPKVEKIEGLEHANSLKKLCAMTHWNVPGIQSLENVERLKKLKLKCETMSAVKPCIQSIKGKECPKEIWIQGSIIRLEEPIVNSLELEFPDLVVLKPSDIEGFPEDLDGSDDSDVGEIPDDADDSKVDEITDDPDVSDDSKVGGFPADSDELEVGEISDESDDSDVGEIADDSNVSYDWDWDVGEISDDSDVSEESNEDDIPVDSDVSCLYYVEKEEENGEERKVVRICYSEHELDHGFPRNKTIVVFGKRERVAEAFYQLLELLE
ncbi:disease resistance protein Roq1-like [Cryptomeria japonica]|uniref:disease resistance protein Roq1-like n=1 Tax=Cryptomeria japonica TaxID=3369 RepID=UPI0027D9E88B|nr:disease resistance protein Roq1-like [Cryptomeria japonica]